MRDKGARLSGTGGGSLRVMDVHKLYRTENRALEILRGVNLVVASGEFVALRGASGTGKSTLLNVCGALDSPDQGSVMLGDTDLTKLGKNEAAVFRRRNIGFIFQSFHLLPEFTALENVALPGKLAGHAAPKVISSAEELLRRVGLGDRMNHRPSQLSGGEQQRVGLARALINSPRVILADEPSGNLDSQTGSEILDLLLHLRRESGMTLVIATHDPAIAARAERSVHLVDGRVAA